MSNAFLKAVQQHDFLTENGALSHSTTGDALLDYFAKAATYRQRSATEVAGDLSRMWAVSPLMTLMIVFYNRMVSRPLHGFVDCPAVQKGQGSRDEFRKAICWLHISHPDVLEKNLWLVPVVGKWNDLWHEDVVETLPRDKVYALVERGLTDDFNRPLIAKYLPRIRSKSNITQPRHLMLNAWARGLCTHLSWTEREYRKFKSNPEHRAHEFQRQMCARAWDALDFSRIPGKALFKLVSDSGKDGKSAIERNVEARYIEWLDGQPVAKFTGYVYELVRAVKGQKLSRAKKMTFDKQFAGLIDLATKDHGGLRENVWCAIDTSGSMQAQVAPGVSAFDICIGMGVYFASLNEGAFKDHVVMFDNTSSTLKLAGTFTDKIQQILGRQVAWGSTNFQSVIDEIVRVRKDNPSIPVSDFPTTLIVVSDMQFNPGDASNTQTNYDLAMTKLKAVGLPKLRIVWWWVTGRGKDFPTSLDDKGVIMIGGFDGAILSLLLGGEAPKVDAPVSQSTAAAQPSITAAEAMVKALDQEVLRQLRV